MALTFAEASRALAQVTTQTADFEQACAEQIREKQDELDGVDTALRAVLAHQAHLKLPDGSYLYLKDCQSTRALNETRIARAIEALTGEQCNDLAQQNPDWTTVQILAEAVADNLDAECIVHSSAPAIVKRVPDPSANWRPAPAAVASQAARYQVLRDQLSQMRKHRSNGKKRAAEVQAVAEPVVRAYLEQHNVAKQVVQFGAPVAVAAPLNLPPMPVLPIVTPSATSEPTPVAAYTVETTPPGVQAGQKVLFTTRTYTSRGKAPKLTEFIDALPQSLQSVAPSGWKQALQNKGDVLKALLALYQSKFQTDQGSVKKRLVVKSVQ